MFVCPPFLLFLFYIKVAQFNEKKIHLRWVKEQGYEGGSRRVAKFLQKSILIVSASLYGNFATLLHPPLRGYVVGPIFCWKILDQAKVFCALKVSKFN